MKVLRLPRNMPFDMVACTIGALRTSFAGTFQGRVNPVAEDFTAFYSFAFDLLFAGFFQALRKPFAFLYCPDLW
jgi:hypothetical protein